MAKVDDRTGSEGFARLSGVSALGAGLSFMLDPIDYLEQQVARHGPLISVELGLSEKRRSRALIMVGPKFNREVLLATDLLRPTGLWPVRGPCGSAQRNLRATYLSMHGDEHRKVSSMVAAVLERPVVLSHFEAVKGIARDHISSWPSDEVVDVAELIRELAQSYAFSLIYGEADPSVARRFGAMLGDYHASNWNKVARVRLNLPRSPYRKVLRQAETLQAFILDWMKSASACPHINVRGVLAAGDGLTQEQAAAHLAGSALASYETTAATLTWMLVLLACHPEVLARLEEELALAKPIADMTIRDLDALTYLDGVIKETMRLIAPAPLLGFKMSTDGKIAGVDLERGASLIISPHLTHREPNLFPDPRRFNPDRWKGIRPNTYEYLPFSGGPRRCPGYLFALQNLKIALMTILETRTLSLLSSNTDQLSVCRRDRACIERAHAVRTTGWGWAIDLGAAKTQRDLLQLVRSSLMANLEA